MSDKSVLGHRISII